MDTKAVADAIYEEAVKEAEAAGSLMPLSELPKRLQCGVCGRWFKTRTWDERNALGPLADHVFGEHGLDEAEVFYEDGSKTSIQLIAHVDEDGVRREKPLAKPE